MVEHSLSCVMFWVSMGSWHLKGILSARCVLIGQYLNKGLTFQSVRMMLLCDCVFADISGTEAGGVLCLVNANTGFSLANSVLTNCACRNGGGGDGDDGVNSKLDRICAFTCARALRRQECSSFDSHG